MSVAAGTRPPDPLGPGALTVQVEPGADALTIVLRGELDLASAEAFERTLRDAEASPGRLVVDLSGLGFIDSTGIHVLLEAQRRSGGRISLRRGPDEIHRVLELTRVTDCFAFEDDAAPVAVSQASPAPLPQAATRGGPAASPSG
ncbi:MAG: anti-sigma factor antagonist [Solirubrobacteraceae bacterium]|jgi:anti-sigma B factor antagonist|nr:anti-sigma factor antagonist [Solirubrobacteraceae bacterium]